MTCAEYTACLEAAVIRGWPSWTCNACDVSREMTPDELARDVPGLVSLGLRAGVGELPAHPAQNDNSRRY